MLDDLQRRIASIIVGLEEAETFVLAGGGALIVLGVVSRSTRDLDYFTTRPEDVQRLEPTLVDHLQSAGMKVVVEQAAPGFVRLMISIDGMQTRVDLSTDARLLAPAQTDFGSVLSAEELAVDKVLAVFGRAEPRDFLDLAVLESMFDLPSLFSLARQKDLGFDVSVFRQMLDRCQRLSRDEFDVDDKGYAELLTQLERWKDEIDA